MRRGNIWRVVLVGGFLILVGNAFSRPTIHKVDEDRPPVSATPWQEPIDDNKVVRPRPIDNAPIEEQAKNIPMVPFEEAEDFFHVNPVPKGCN